MFLACPALLSSEMNYCGKLNDCLANPSCRVPPALCTLPSFAVNQMNYCGKDAGGDTFSPAAILYTLGGRAADVVRVCVWAGWGGRCASLLPLPPAMASHLPGSCHQHPPLRHTSAGLHLHPTGLLKL
jgi:hypothetical protein